MHRQRDFCDTKITVSAHRGNIDVELSSYQNDQMPVDLSLSLILLLDRRFTLERRVRQIMGFTKFGERYHVLDGWVHFDDKENPVAIELELSTKGTERLEKIVRDHAWDFDIEEVWYFVESDVVRRHMKRVTEEYDTVRILNVPDDVTAGLPQELGFA
ncbi:MAG: hypothetical protein ACR2QH_00825 [Geminicoccaceae bacterium]